MRRTLAVLGIAIGATLPFVAAPAQAGDASPVSFEDSYCVVLPGPIETTACTGPEVCEEIQAICGD